MDIQYVVQYLVLVYGRLFFFLTSKIHTVGTVVVPVRVSAPMNVNVPLSHLSRNP